jgi:kynurenine formamidase
MRKAFVLGCSVALFAAFGTAHAQDWTKSKWGPNAGEPGVGVEGAKYLTGKGVVAVGADTWAVEAIPFESKNVFEVHQILLPMNGTYILENMDTAELAKDKAYEFMFVLGQPRFRGGVQSMINPIAIR